MSDLPDRSGTPATLGHAARISGNTRVFMILGDPVAQVRAPDLFNRIFARHGVDAVLVPARVAAKDFAAFVRHALCAQNIDGLWLAIPHKGPMVLLLDRCELRGRVAQAVNAVRRNADGTLEGALLDGLGFVKALDHFGFDPCGKRALLVGAGGAGAAIAVSLAERGLARLSLHDIDAGRCELLAARLRQSWPLQVQVLATPDPGGCELVVNASPLGLQLDDALPIKVARLEPAALVIDIVMKERPTALLRACAERGVRAYPGFEMLVQQVPDYLHFFGLHEVADALQDLSEVRALLLSP